MNRKFKLLILSLLGFSAACTGVKNNAKSKSDNNPQPVQQTNPEIRLMYGVRRPMPADATDKTDAADSLANQSADSRTDDTPELKSTEVELQPQIRVMYGVRVPLENIDLDSLKQAQRQQQQQQQQPAEQQQSDN